MNNLFPKTVVGVDVAGNDLRVAILRSAFGKLRLVSTFAVEDFAQMDAVTQRQELLKIGERHQLNGSRIFLSLPEESGVARQLEFPIEAAADLKSAVELQVESLSPWPVEDVYWDLAWRNSTWGGAKLRVTVAIAERAKLEQWVELFAEAGLHLKGVSIRSLAWAHATTRLWPDDQGTMVMTLGTEQAEGTFIRGEAIVSTRVTEDLPGQERVRRVAMHLMSVGRVQSPDEIRVLAYGQDVGELDSDNSALPIDGAAPDSVHSFGAIAAALSGLGKSPFSLNLLPEAMRFRSNQMQLIPTYVGLAFVLLAVSILFVREPYQWSSYAAELDEAIAAVASEAADVTDQETELNLLSDRYRALSIHLNGRDSTLEALDALTRVIPPDTWMTSFSLNEGGVTVSGFSNGAADVQRLVEESESFENAEFVSSVVRDDRGRDRFTLRFDLEDPS